jgi:hypothetical protein
MTDNHHRPDNHDGLHAQTPPDPSTPQKTPTPQDPDAPDAQDAQDVVGDPLALSELIAAGDIDVVPGDPPVPIAVWRVADVDAAYGHAHADALSPRMAALLVGSYTRPDDTIVSVSDDPALAGAAGAGGRRYLSVSDPDDLAGLDHVAGTVALIVLPWPPPYRPGRISREYLTQIFRVCRRLMRRDGCTIVALADLPPDETYVQHSGALIPAAHRAGLGWLQHIIAITAPIAGQRITWQAAPADPATVRAAAHVAVHIDLLVFAVRQGRHG